MKKARWYNMGFLATGVSYCLFTDKKLFKKEYRKSLQSHKMNDSCPGFILNNLSNATVHTITSGFGDITAFVCIDITNISSAVSNEQLSSLLVHEVVHIWQEIKEVADIGTPNKEFEAEAIQRITQDLLKELFRIIL